MYVWFFFNIIFFFRTISFKKQTLKLILFLKAMAYNIICFSCYSFVRPGELKKNLEMKFSDSPYLFSVVAFKLCTLYMYLSIFSFIHLSFIFLFSRLKWIFFINIKVKLLQWTHTMRKFLHFMRDVAILIFISHWIYSLT